MLPTSDGCGVNWLKRWARPAEGRVRQSNTSRAAGERDDEEAFRLRERAAYQFCVSGLIDEGRQTFGGVLQHLGLKLPSSRRAALIGLLLRRLWLTIRGLRFRRTEERHVPRKEIDRIDLLWSVTGGLTMIDPIPGAQCQVQHLLLSLRSGEPSRITRAMAWEATHVSMLGTAYRARVARLLAEASALAGDPGEPYARGLIKLSGCVAAFFLADPPRCRELGDEAAAIFGTIVPEQHGSSISATHSHIGAVIISAICLSWHAARQYSWGWPEKEERV